MTFTFGFVLNSILFGAALAADAFSICVANGLGDPCMTRGKALSLAVTFGAFQVMMPLAGWFCVRMAAEQFEAFSAYIPWIALILLLMIGLNMIFETRANNRKGGEPCPPSYGAGVLILQGIATSIDALSVGFTIADYGAAMAVAESLIIGAVTFILCIAGTRAGSRAGRKLAKNAGYMGGGILIAIGLEIFVRGMGGL